MKWNPVDWIVVILAAPVVLALLIAVAGPNLLGGAPSSSDKLEIVGNIMSAIVAVISVYVGSKMKQ